MKKKLFHWTKGRKNSGYEIFTLIHSIHLPFDCYIIRYPTGAYLVPHRDPVKGKKHYRCNIILKSPKRGGEFVCADPIISWKRLKFFRSDLSEHSITEVLEGSRYIFSFGWVKKV
jgi:hypothetical protein